ncbi:MAG: universal stress protein [Proteobacteria bacterium]|nr:universal stress protein [Pseudomonadota bacterium]NIS67779.1 universal stress protein [Pseudomonadota bacterium]
MGEHIPMVALQGDPAERIIEFAREKSVDMIVIGSRGLGPVKGLFLGSVSTKVCHLADCTCVTVKETSPLCYDPRLTSYPEQLSPLL